MTAAATEGTGTQRRSGATAVFAGILLSRIAGLVREILLRSQLGLGVVADAFAAAMRIPNLMQNLLGEGVLSASFIPVYSRMLEDEDEDAGPVAATVAALLLAITTVMVILMIVLAGPITAVLALGFGQAQYELTVRLVRIIALGTGLLVMSSWCLGILNSHRRFFLSYVAPVFWNAAQIAVLVYTSLELWTEVDTAVAVAWAVVAGSAAQLVVQLPSVLRLERGLRRGGRRRWVPGHPAVRSVMSRMVPAVLGRGVVQLSAYIDQFLASFLAAGAVAALMSAQVLYLLPVSLFVMSIAAAELPELSRRPEAIVETRHRVAEGLERVWFFIGLTTVAYLFAGDLIVALLFQRDRFTADDTMLVSLVLAAYALGLPAVGPSRLLQNVLYSQGDVRTPAQLAATRVFVSAAVGVVLMFQFDQLFVYDGNLTGWATMTFPVLEPLPAFVRDDDSLPLRAGAVGLALGASAGAWVEYLLLRSRVQLALSRRQLAAGRVAPLLAGSVVSAVVVVGTRLASSGLPLLVESVIVAAGGTISYLGTTYALGATPARHLVATLRRRAGV